MFVFVNKIFVDYVPIPIFRECFKHAGECIPRHHLYLSDYLHMIDTESPHIALLITQRCS